jgi:hypothetical protein
MTQKFILGGTLLLALALFACKQDPKNAANTTTPNAASGPASASTLAGNWFPIDFCARAARLGSVQQALQVGKPYALAFSINGSDPDSVTCYNGFETWKLAVVYKDNTVEFKNAAQKLSVFFEYDPEAKELLMIDGTSGQPRTERYQASRAEVKTGYEAFLMALNNNFLSGDYQPLGKGEALRFLPDGNLKGMADFNKYELCTGGDCFVSADELDIITLRRLTKQGTLEGEKTFGLRFGAKRDTLTLYNLKSDNPEEKGNYKTAGVAYRFLRKATATGTKK